MLTQLRLQNFRCFDDHFISFRPCTIIVGRNNAGKSTIVDALRLLSVVTARYQSLVFHQPPNWIDLPRRDVGVSPSIRGMEFNIDNLFHRYGSPPSTITASFANGAIARIHIGPEGALHAVISNPDGSILRDRSSAREGLLPRVEIMPQVAPLLKTETVLSPDYVRANLSSILAPQHFRNQLNLLRNYLPALRELAEETWPGLQIQDLVRTVNDGVAVPNTPLSLMVRNDDYVSEVAAMGHGLQMWLQTMWFLARTDAGATITLDEPDVYMHPDLQRRLIRHLRKTGRQVVVTTHSVEIMSEVGPEDILVIDRLHRQSHFAASLPAVQLILDHIGSAQNIQLARLWHARKTLFVEGKDVRLLSDFFDILFPRHRDGLTSIPTMSIGGWGGWQYAIGSSMLLQNSGGEEVSVYCILDSDYHTDTQKAARRTQAGRAGVHLHIWTRKEIENYLLVPAAIHRLILSRVAKRMVKPEVREVEAQLEIIFNSLKDEVFDGMSAELLADDRGLGAAGANKRARAVMETAWISVEGRTSIVSGKAALSQLSKWTQDQFGMSVTASAIARAMQPEDVPNEIRDVVTAIANRQPLMERVS